MNTNKSYKEIFNDANKMINALSANIEKFNMPKGEPTMSHGTLGVYESGKKRFYPVKPKESKLYLYYDRNI